VGTFREKLNNFNAVFGNGAQGRNRTTDTVIFSHVLYQLSYLGAGLAVARPQEERCAL
jgi:hypothetical protein